MPFKIAGITPIPHGIAVNAQSQFANCVMDLFRQARPSRIIETGTYLGMGTTAAIGNALRQWGIEAEFFTIEVNPQRHAAAVQNIQRQGFRARALLGLSVPRSLLPSQEQIQKDVVEQEVDGIFVDHMPENRAELYRQEVDFPGVEDDLLGKCLKHFNEEPDFLLLDSAGHMGNLEFNYVVPQIKRRCYFGLDDTNHVKHFESVRQMKADARFRILFESQEKFGFCFAEFTP